MLSPISDMWFAIKRLAMSCGAADWCQRPGGRLHGASIPPVRTPPDLEVTGTHGELYFAVSAGIEIYFTQIFAGKLNIEYHSHGPAPERSVEAIRSLLCAIAEQHAATGVS